MKIDNYFVIPFFLSYIMIGHCKFRQEMNLARMVQMKIYELSSLVYETVPRAWCAIIIIFLASVLYHKAYVPLTPGQV